MFCKKTDGQRYQTARKKKGLSLYNKEALRCKERDRRKTAGHISSCSGGTHLAAQRHVLQKGKTRNICQIQIITSEIRLCWFKFHPLSQMLAQANNHFISVSTYSPFLCTKLTAQICPHVKVQAP